jgi:hypothetical protein
VLGTLRAQIASPVLCTHGTESFRFVRGSAGGQAGQREELFSRASGFHGGGISAS